MKKTILITSLISYCIMIGGCKEFLDQKPDKKLIVPKTIEDYQALMDNSDKMNQGFPSASLISADNLFTSDVDFKALNEIDRNLYLWKHPSVNDVVPNDWSNAYMRIYYSNIVLEGLDKITVSPSNRQAWQLARGSALFFRAQNFFLSMLLWAKGYDRETADTNFGIPLKLTTNINTNSHRASIKEGYERIINDLRDALALLPSTSPHYTRPTKAAAHALLSRVFLSMHDYNAAYQHADSCLRVKSDLVDYNEIAFTGPYPFKRFNKEVILHCRTRIPLPAPFRIDSSLVDAYKENDLRKAAFFKMNDDRTYVFKGSYDGSVYPFLGITTSEMYLTRAECLARLGKVSSAMDDLNYLLARRYDGSFVPFTADGEADALDQILLERRKELVLRDIRWMDIKRLNREGKGIVITRKVNGMEYSLEPNDSHYALMIPEQVIEISGMPQNIY